MVDPAIGMTRLRWLTTGPVEATPGGIKAEVAKLQFLRLLGADALDLSVLPAERRRFLAALGRRLTAQALQRRDPQRRYPILLTGAGGHVDYPPGAALKHLLWERPGLRGGAGGVPALFVRVEVVVAALMRPTSTGSNLVFGHCGFDHHVQDVESRVGEAPVAWPGEQPRCPCGVRGRDN